MNQKKMKLADIAELVGVSKSTVSFVLNGHATKHRIAPETVMKVEEVVKQYGYAPSTYARALKSNQTFTLGLVIPDLANMGFAMIAKKLERQSRELGYQLLIVSSEDDCEQEKRVVKSLLDRQVDLIISATSMLDAHFYSEVKKQVPIVFFDRVINQDEFTSIKTDARDATRQLIANLAKGCDECVYLGGQLHLSPSQDRLAGYRDGLAEVGIEYDDEWVLHQDFQPESGYQMMADIVNRKGGMPAALFTASYSIFEGVLKYLTDHRLFDHKIRLATFDHYTIIDCLPIQVGSIEQDSDSIAQAIFTQVQSLIDDPMMTPRHIVLPAKLHFIVN